MLLRDHPLMSYHGIPSWPPVWTFVTGLEKKHPRRGEIGILKKVTVSNVRAADRCFLHIDYEGSTYVGCLLVEDPVFCDQIVALLQGYVNRAIEDIRSLDITFTL